MATFRTLAPTTRTSPTSKASGSALMNCWLDWDQATGRASMASTGLLPTCPITWPTSTWT